MAFLWFQPAPCTITISLQPLVTGDAYGYHLKRRSPTLSRCQRRLANYFFSPSFPPLFPPPLYECNFCFYPCFLFPLSDFGAFLLFSSWRAILRRAAACALFSPRFFEIDFHCCKCFFCASPPPPPIGLFFVSSRPEIPTFPLP